MTLQLRWIERLGFGWALGLCLLIAGPALAAPPQNTCLDCHSALEGNLQVTAEKWATDIHMVKGFTCADCHGGDPTQMDDKLAMNRAKGFLGAPKGMAIVQLCGKCHSDAAFMKKYNPAERVDQVSEYFSTLLGWTGSAPTRSLTVSSASK